MAIYYGLTSIEMLVQIVYAVCNVLGRGNNDKAALLMLETAAQETRLGTLKDNTPYKAGRGVFQCDLVGFVDVQGRVGIKDYQAVLDAFGIDLKKASHSQLDYSPLLAAIICRLFYKLRPEPIPDDLEGRARYWKRFYNTSQGKGTPEQYVSNSQMLNAVDVNALA